MSGLVKVTDRVGDGGVVVCDVDDVADTIRGWYLPYPQDRGISRELSRVLRDLQKNLDRHEYIGAEESYLGISIEDYEDDEE